MGHDLVLLHERTTRLVNIVIECVRMRRCTRAMHHTTQKEKHDAPQFFHQGRGSGLVEYALILVLIAIVVIGILTMLGGKVSQVFSSINSGLK
jgi:pilus assembly protein Flp/PilA